MKFNIKTDSRKVVKGDIFVALKGINTDGHDYIESAIKNGAETIIAEYGNYSVNTIIVDDTRKYLTEYLKEEYKEIFNKLKLIVVTGTNGKTTVAYLLYQALNLLNHKCAYLGTIGFYKQEGKISKFNNTTPDICEVYEELVNAYNEGYEFFTLEASSQGLALHRLDDIFYDYSIFTNLTHDHLDFHKTMENYARAKRQVFDNLKTGGKAIINIDDSYANKFILDKNINLTYGKGNADFKIHDIYFNKNNTSFKIDFENNTYDFKTSLIGEYNVYNILPVIIILKDLNYSFKEIMDVLPKLKNGKGRMETILYKDNMIVVDYAHTPDGIEKITSTIKDVIKGNIYIVFGVRGNRDRTKRKDMTNIATSVSRKVIITTNHLNNEDINQIINDLTTNVDNKNYEVILDRKLAIEKGISYLEKDDALLILGKGHEDYLNLGDHTIHFDDIEEVKKIINSIEVKI